MPTELGPGLSLPRIPNVYSGGGSHILLPTKGELVDDNLTDFELVDDNGEIMLVED